ncbi:hypothetical protein D8Y22_11455 [Salinadaptatus halalkaliphilus]|uniref:Thioredoxin domain-containing protein n=1 Tax=Salinadaptatus halalkaliphilus TaxID=2419781 RepID=A0A4S3TNC8_9EURY|nr:hypothetical protein [Salinadaptatus halalkaliphilus]THE64723.1 hypothetical protein D8Y22_11455 [Salinadaptatus halalkaliphilus]
MADDRRFDRRQFLRGLGGGSLAVIAGCLGDEDEPDAEEGAEVDPEPVSVGADATWRTTELTDVRTDETFRLGSFDRPVVIHTFGVGCAVCHAQHSEFESLWTTTAGVEIVDLTIDVNAEPATIREYAADEGYDWRFAVASEDVIGSLSSDYGNAITRSSASPVVVSCPDGQTYRLEKIADAEALDGVLETTC